MKIKRRKNNNIILWLIIAMISLFCLAGGTYYVMKKQNNSSNENRVNIVSETGLRTGPDENYPVLTTVKLGTSAKNLSKVGDWYEIETEDKYVGWLPGWTIQGSGIKSPEIANKEKLANYTVVLNPAIENNEIADYRGKYPRDYNLEVAKNLAEKLRKDSVKVILTRENNDTIPTKEEVKKLVADNKGDFLLDIDVMHAEGKNNFGVRMYYGNTPSTQVAKIIEKQLTDHYIEKITTSEKQSNFESISEKLPHIKIISGNISDKVDIDIMSNQFTNDQYINSLKDGIERYFYYLIEIDNYNAKRKEQLLSLPQKGLTIPMYYTKQENYKNISYGTDNTKTIESNGDAIISLAMISSYLTGESAPKVEDIASWAGNNYYIAGQGTTPRIVPAFAEKQNYKIENVTLDAFDKVKEALRDNKPVLVRFKSGLFGTKTTYKVIRGFEDDKFYLNDPDDDDIKLNSYNGFTENDIKTNIAQGWIFSKN